jgi:uncharacterized membrane protein YbaN (DUF454 family)
MREAIRKPLMLALGCLSLAVGVAGAFIPVFQGWIFVLIGLAIFARESQTVRGWIRSARRRWPGFSEKVHKASNGRHVPHELKKVVRETDPDPQQR